MKKISLKVNSVPRECVVDEKMVLIDLLRQDLCLTGTKQACDRKGQCGACTVIVDGKTTRSCLKKVVDLEGADVITVEGLGTPDNPHLIQEAFVLAGAIQCGFCTPGMIMATKGLLDENNNPSDDDIKKALRRNLCRCTGYSTIIEAVKLAGRFIRGETTPDKMLPPASAGYIGVSHPRPSSYLKACGAVEYTGDIVVPNMLEIAVVRSPHYNALIKSIDYSEAETMPGVVGVVTDSDIMGSKSVAVLVPDEPIFYPEGGIAPVMGAPIVGIVARTREEALAAAKAVKVEYEVLPRITTVAESIAEGAAKINPDPDYPNIVYQAELIRGDAQKALASSANVIEARVKTQMQPHSPLEPETALAYMDGEGDDAQLVVIGRSIHIHMHAVTLSTALGWDNVRYIEAFSGGQFGIKCDITAEGQAAAAALKFRRPVRYTMSLTESMMTTPKRHPADMRVKMGADANGKITAYDIDYDMENGAHTSLGTIVMDRFVDMLSSAYDLPNVKLEGKLVYTNDSWGGAFRGAGPPQSNFAIETMVDMMADKLKIDPWEFRMKNMLRPGGTIAVGQKVDSWEIIGCMETMKPLYEKACKEAKKKSTPELRRGVGLGGASFGIGSPNDSSNVAVELNPDNGVTVYAGVADPGEGNDAMLSQIASHCLGIPLKKVRLVTRDSELAPDSGISASSRQTYMSGGALVKACEILKEAMKEVKAKTHADLIKAGKPTKYMGKKLLGDVQGIDKKTGEGKVWGSFVHNVQMAEVEVNTKTGEVKILKMTTVVDAGTVLNPQALIGQVDGGVDMGVGFALREEYVLGKTNDFNSIGFPTITMSFPKETIILETPRPKGPLGATGIGESTMTSTHPTVANAIFNATGIRFTEIPITPKKILAAMGK